MNSIHGHPEVTTFVDLVRLFLADLEDDVRDELTGGLEADLADLVDERGVEALPDPERYAEELRTAAGLPHPAVPVTTEPTGTVGRRWNDQLDAWRRGWMAWANVGRRRPVWEFLVSVRPVWWVVRAWAAVAAVETGLVVEDPTVDVFPRFGNSFLDALVLGTAIVVSVQVGRGRWWPGRLRDSVGARTLLLALNATAVLGVPLLLEQTPTSDPSVHESVLVPASVPSHGKG